RRGRHVALRRVHDDHAALGGRFLVDVVHADAGAADDLELRPRLDDLLGDLRGAADDQPFVVGDRGLEVLGLHLALEVDLDAGLGEDAGALLAYVVGDENFRHVICSLAPGTWPRGYPRGSPRPPR